MFSIVEVQSEWAFELSLSAYVCFLVGGIAVGVLLSSWGERAVAPTTATSPHFLCIETSVREAGGYTLGACPDQGEDMDTRVGSCRFCSDPLLNLGYGTNCGIAFHVLQSLETIISLYSSFTLFSAFELEFVTLFEWTEGSQSLLIRNKDWGTHVICHSFKILVVTAGENIATGCISFMLCFLMKSSDICIQN